MYALAVILFTQVSKKLWILQAVLRNLNHVMLHLKGKHQEFNKKATKVAFFMSEFYWYNAKNRYNCPS